MNDDVLKDIVSMLNAVSAITDVVADYGTDESIYYGEVPNDTQLPFILVTDVGIISRDTHSTHGQRIDIQIDCVAFSGYTALGLDSLVKDALHKKKLTAGVTEGGRDILMTSAGRPGYDKRTEKYGFTSEYKIYTQKNA